MKVLYRSTLIVLALLAIVSSPVNVYSCGPFFPTTIFVQHTAPDLPIESFLQGEIGIVQPEFSSIYLFIAYRYLSGKPLSTDEQRLISIVLGKRFTRRYDDSSANAYKMWLSARQSVLGPGAVPQFPVEAEIPTSLYESYLNISPDAFVTAANTLLARIAQFGAPNPHIVNWVNAQDQVFMSQTEEIAPPEAEPDAPQILRADRSYQIAAAHFYMRHFDTAESLFTLIGRDNSSPWNHLSRYLVARCMIREATLLETNQDPLLHSAENYLRGLLSDPEIRHLQPAIQRLIDYCLFKTSPYELFLILDKKISSGNIDTLFPTEWGDYAQLLRRYADSLTENSSDFARWRACYKGEYDPNLYARAIRRWNETKSPAWLIAALSDASPVASDFPELLRAGASISIQQSEYMTVNYWRVRFLDGGKDNELGRKLIDTLLVNNSARNSISNTNLLLSERVRFVENLDEFLKYSHQHPYGVVWDDEPTPVPLESFTPNTTVLNRYLPLTLLDSACRSPFLPINLREAITRGTWVRSVLLSDTSVSLDVAKILRGMQPSMAPLLDQYSAETNPSSRRFTAACLMLKYPGLFPYVRIGLDRETPLNELSYLRDNWWYDGDLAIEASSHASLRYRRSFFREAEIMPTTPPSFLGRSEVEQAENETKRLRSLPAAATYFGEITTAFAKMYPKDPRVPEALHLTVNASRLGCRDERTSVYSKRAFTFLHKNYPQSEWTKKTPYWY